MSMNFPKREMVEILEFLLRDWELRQQFVCEILFDFCLKKNCCSVCLEHFLSVCETATKNTIDTNEAFIHP